MTLELDAFKTQETGINHWCWVSELSEERQDEVIAKLNEAEECLDIGSINPSYIEKAGTILSSLIENVGIESMDSYSLLSSILKVKADQVQVLESGYALIEKEMKSRGFGLQDRIEYGYIQNRPFYRLAYNLAVIYQGQPKKRKKALNIFQLLYAGNPNDNMGIRSNLVWNYIADQQLDKAFNICRAYVNEEYDDSELAYAAALIAVKRNNMKAAKEYFTRGFKSTPLYGYLIVQDHERIMKKYMPVVAGQAEMIVNSLDEAIIMYRKSYQLWQPHLDFRTGMDLREMIFRIINP